MSVPDREAVREALAVTVIPDESWNLVTLDIDAFKTIEAAARAWLGLENAIIIQRDENGEWPMTDEQVDQLIRDCEQGEAFSARYRMSDALKNYLDGLSA